MERGESSWVSGRGNREPQNPAESASRSNETGDKRPFASESHRSPHTREWAASSTGGNVLVANPVQSILPGQNTPIPRVRGSVQGRPSNLNLGSQRLLATRSGRRRDRTPPEPFHFCNRCVSQLHELCSACWHPTTGAPFLKGDGCRLNGFAEFQWCVNA